MKVYYDATQLVHWEGNITGIPRVMNEIAVRFAQDADFSVSYVSWVKSQSSLLHVDFQTSIINRGSGIKYLKHGEQEVLEANNKITQSTAQISSKTLQKKIAKKGLSAIRRVKPGIAQRIEIKSNDIRFKQFMRAEPKRGDIIFIGWGEWWDDGFIEYLRHQASKGVRIVQIIHDLLPLSDPQFSGHSTVSLGRYCEAILPISALVLCVSEYTKEDTVRWLQSKKLKIPDIVHFRLGDDFQSKNPKKPLFNEMQKKRIKPGNFVLSVGTLEARKNFTLFYYAYKLAISRGKTLPPLVHVGRKGWKTENIFDIVSDDPAVKDKIIFMGGVSDEELAWYYQNCKYLAHPSFCEGWGLQIAESAMNGKPVVASKTSSMPEVIKDKAVYINPFSSDELLEAMLEMESPSSYKRQLKKIESYVPRTWDESYNEVKKHMQLILKEKK